MKMPHRIQETKAAVILAAFSVTAGLISCGDQEGPCIYEDVSFGSPDSRAPWGTLFSDDAKDLSGSWTGVLEWRTGGSFVDVGPVGTTDVSISIDVDPESAIGSLQSSSRYLCPEEYSFETEFGILSSTGDLDGTVSVKVSRIDGGIPEYVIRDRIEIEDLVPGGVVSFTEEALTYDIQEYYILVYYLNDYNELYGEVYAIGSKMVSDTTGFTAYAVIAEFSASRTN